MIIGYTVYRLSWAMVCAGCHCYFSFWTIFYPFTLLTAQTMKISKKKNEKKTPRDIIILHYCAKTHDHRLYCSWDMVHGRCNYFPFWAIFCQFAPPPPPPQPPKKKKTQKLKKKLEDIIILQKCTKNHDHRLYCSWDMVCAGCNYFSFWAIFYPFTLLTVRKMKIKRNWKKHLEISSFYTNVPKIMIIGCTVPEIWHMMNVIIIFLGYFLPFNPPNSRIN